MFFARKFFLSFLISLTALAAWAAPVRLGLVLSPTTTSTQTLEAAANAGVHRVRISADWTQIQPRANAWNFTKLDAMVAAAQQQHCEVVLVPGSAPRWTVTYLGNNPGQEEVRRARPSLSAYRDFMTTLAERYQQSVNYYQLWERPSTSTLLARAADVYALYREGTTAIHAVDPALQVIAMEPGNVDVSWLRDYLYSSTGSARADILALAPLRNAPSPRTFAWRLQVLRSRVLPRQNPPQLWLELPSTPSSLPFAGVSLLQGIADISFNPLGVSVSEEELQTPIKFLSSLQGAFYRGWTQLSPDIFGGIFGTGDKAVMLVQPFSDGIVSISPADGTVLLSKPGSDPTPVAQTDYDALHIDDGQPVLLSGVRAITSQGLPNFQVTPVTSSTISLDLTGSDPTAIRPLRALSGGRYNDYTLDDHHIISTVRDEQPWIYFDVPDGFMFFNVERVPVEVTIQVLGVLSKQKTGFNLYYDAFGGMRSTPWQWVDVGTHQVFTYTMRLDDALFSGGDGYDFRINMGGSEENVRVIGMSITKLAH